MHNIVVPEVWVTAVTNRGLAYLPNVVRNFTRQKYPLKKLCIIINSVVNKSKIREYVENQGVNATIVFMPTSSLGECLNRSVDLMFEEKSAYVFSKMDDDDYYGENYLLHNVADMMRIHADIVGRRDLQIFVPERRRLYFMKNGGHRKFVNWVQGSSLTIRRDVFAHVRFPNRNTGEDTRFQQDAKKKGFRIFASCISDYVVIRHVDKGKHTWKIELQSLLKRCVDLGSKKSAEFEKEDHLCDVLQGQNVDPFLRLKPYLSGSTK